MSKSPATASRPTPGAARRGRLRVESSGAGLRRERLGRGLLAGSALLFFGGAGLGQVIPDPGGALVMLGGVGCFLLGLLARYAVWRRPGTITVTADELRVGETVRVGRDAVIGGWWCSDGHKRRVELQLDGGTVLSAYVPTADSADRLLEAVAASPSQRALRMSLEGGSRRFGIGYGAALLGILPCAAIAYLLLLPLSAGRVDDAMHAYLSFALTTLWIWAAVRTLGHGSVTVGADGVVIERRWRSRFIPRARLKRAELKDKRLELVLADGERLSLAVSNDDAAKEVAKRIRRLSIGADLDDTVVLDLLGRQGRTLAAWLADLATHELDRGDYRSVAFGAEQLLARLADPSAPSDERLAAALLLSRSEHPEAATRIESAIRASVNEPLCRALEGIAAGHLDDDDLDRATRAEQD